MRKQRQRLHALRITAVGPSLSWANILEELLSKDQLVVIDALRIYKKYTDLFDLDAIPEEDIKIAAEQVVDITLEQI